MVITPTSIIPLNKEAEAPYAISGKYLGKAL